ncbi:hypothetical protein FocTR4_00001402, partial [Fusarium oxysporum f. sp. cubense]
PHNIEQVTYGNDTSGVCHSRLHDDLQEAHDVGSVSIRSLLVVGAEMPIQLEISMADVEQPEGEPQGRIVKYCGVCTLPPEYCEYGGTVKKCQEWLEKNEPELYNRIWSAEALEAATASLSVEAQKRAAKDAQKKTAKAEAAEAKHADLLAKSVVTIKRIERNKKKFVTAVIGLESFDLELKKVAKDLGKKFATGSSVTKLPGGGEEIVVQGDVSVELEEFLLEKYKQIPEDHIELVEDKKKKKGGS